MNILSQPSQGESSFTQSSDKILLITNSVPGIVDSGKQDKIPIVLLTIELEIETLNKQISTWSNKMWKLVL